MNLVDEINQRKSDGLYRIRKVVDFSKGPFVTIEREEYINFSSNDYLGLADDTVLKECMIDAIEEYGIGGKSSQLVTGYSKPHRTLEERLAKFLKRDAALVFSSGYLANLAIASVLINKNTIVLQDKLNHASLIDAAQLSAGSLVRYSHGDTSHLETLLEKYSKYNLVVMTDGVFSMDGDFAPIVEIAKLCKKYDAVLIVDDAHGIGVLGETGAGLLELKKLNQAEVPLLIGTFGKSFGGCGAFISGSSLYIEAFVQKARTYIYTTAMPPSLAVTMTKAIELVINGIEQRENLYSLIKFYKESMRHANLRAHESISHIQPYIVGNAKKAVELSEALYRNKLLVIAIRPPTIPRNTSRLRISLTAIHDKKQVMCLVKNIKNKSDNE